MRRNASNVRWPALLPKRLGSTRCEGELSAAQSAGRRASSRLKSSSCSAALSSAVSLRWAATSNRHHRCSMTEMHTAAATTTTPRPTTSTRRWPRGRERPRWQGSDTARRTTAAARIHANSAWTPGINALGTFWEQVVSASRCRRRLESRRRVRRQHGRSGARSTKRMAPLQRAGQPSTSAIRARGGICCRKVIHQVTFRCSVAEVAKCPPAASATAAGAGG